MIEAHAITLLRDGRRVVEDVSLRLVPGLVTALLGPNGAGKSSVFAALTGELFPRSGTVHFEGWPLTSWSSEDLARRRAVVPQHSSAVFPFTVGEIVAFGRHPHRFSHHPAENLAIVEEILRETDLAPLAHREFPTLSGGERQRVQLARALAQIWTETSSPRYLLMDEPSSALDLEHQQKLLREARRLARQGVAVLIVLHDLNLARQQADEVVVMEKGRVVASGPARTVLQPALVSEVFKVSVTCHGGDAGMLGFGPMLSSL